MKKIKNRYAILAIASIVNFVHGNPYIWTVFQPYVRKEYGLSLAASSQPFTIIIGIFALGNMLGGFLQHKVGAKKTILAGSLVMCLGFFLAAVAPSHMPWVISLGYGALGGLGSGCAFSMLVAVPQGWFPDKRGRVTGITVGVIGISGVLMNPLCDSILAGYGYRTAMLVVTAVYAVLCLGAFFIEEAPEELASQGGVLTDGSTKPEGVIRTDGSAKPDESIEAAIQRQFTTREMMHTKAFYAIAITMALAVPAYVLVNPLMKSLGMKRGLTSAQALAGVMIASFANIIGRFAMPWLSDQTGRKAVIRVMYVLAMVSVVGLIAARGGLFILLISIVCLVYGGVVSVFPVLVSEHFGMKYQGMNFGAVMLGYGLASILCPYLLDIAGLNTSFLIAGIACAAGLWGTRYF